MLSNLISQLTEAGKLDKLDEVLEEIPKVELEEVDKTVYYSFEEEEQGFEVKREGDYYVVTGKEIENIMRRINFSDPESLAYFHLMLKKSGIDAALKNQGIREGDIVKIFDWEFEYEE